jgi:hypothetical protein
MRPKIRDVVAEAFKERPYLVFVLEPGVVRTNGDFHVMHFPDVSLPRRIGLRQSPIAPTQGRGVFNLRFAICHIQSSITA